MRSVRANMASMGLPRLFYIESEYLERLCEAELEWVRSLVEDIEGGSLEGIEQWRGWFAGRSEDHAAPSWAFEAPTPPTDTEPIPSPPRRARRSAPPAQGERP
jgi:hypothetical protein